MSLQLGQSNAVLSVKSAESLRVLFTQHGSLSTMTSPVFVFSLVCLFLGKTGEFWFFVILNCMEYGDLKLFFQCTKCVEFCHIEFTVLLLCLSFPFRAGDLSEILVSTSGE